MADLVNDIVETIKKLIQMNEMKFPVDPLPVDLLNNDELSKIIEELTKIKVPDYLLNLLKTKQYKQFSCLRTNTSRSCWKNLKINETNPLVIRYITKIISKLRNSLANLKKDKQKHILNTIRKNTPFYYQMGNRNFIPGVTDPWRSCRITSLAMALHALGVSAYDLVNTTDPDKDCYVDLGKLMNIGNWLAEKYSKSHCKLYNNVYDLLNERFPDFLILLFIYAFYDGKIPHDKTKFLDKIENSKDLLKEKFLIRNPNLTKKTSQAKKTLKAPPAKETLMEKACAKKILIEKICGYFGVKYEGKYEGEKQDINPIKTEMNQGKEILLGWWTPNCKGHVVYLVNSDGNKLIINDPGYKMRKYYSEDKYINCQQKSGLRYRYYEVLSR